MEQIVQQWVETFRHNFPLPPPENDESDPTAWSLNIKELQNFSLSPELKAMPDTATFGLKIYISVFNTATGQFHGRTWTSQLITDVESNFINLTTYGIVTGENSLIVIEFSLCIKYLNNENVESSLFFTILQIPTESTQSMCPLYQGTPRMLMAMPTSLLFNKSQSYLTPRSGCLLVDLQKYDELLKASECMPFCTFFNRPIPGIKSFAPLSLEQVTMLSITGITMNVSKDFELSLHNELNEIISQKYRISIDKTHVRVVKYSIHFSAHNTHKIVSETYKAEVNSINGWSFDGRLSFPNYVKDNPNYALIFQLVISVEIDLSFIEENKLMTSTPNTKEKHIFDVVLGYGIVHVSTDSFSSYKLSRAPKNSPFSMRILQARNIPMPAISFNAIFDTQAEEPDDKRDFAVDFKPLVADDGGALLPFDPKNLPEEPLLMEEFTDKLNTNHLIFLFKFLVPRQNYFERFPVKVFQNIYFRIDIWPFGLVRSEICRLKPFQDTLIFYPVGSKKDDDKGVIISKDVSLKAYEQVVNYFFLMRANELQATMVDADTDIILGSFNIRSSALLRQKRSSMHISTYSKLISVDGELLGNIHISYGCYGTADHKMIRLDFEQRNPINRDIIISKSISENDAEFRKAVRTSVLPRFELAARYRDGHRKEAMLSDLQKKFLRTRILYPVPGLESRFVFTSVYDPEEPTTIFVHSNDERLRFIRKLNESESTYDTDSPERVYHIERDESLEFNQESEVPVSEKFNLKSQKKNVFKVKPDQGEIRLLFAFFTVNDFEENEISVTLNDDAHTLLDCFTVHVKKTAPLAQENVYFSIRKDEQITTTLNSMQTYASSVSSSSLIRATSTIFGTKITSKPLKTSLVCYIYNFLRDNTLMKITRLHVDVLEDEFLRCDSKLKMNISHYIGTRICCKTSDTRIAQFLDYEQPLVLKEPGTVTVKALSSGLVKLVIYNVSKGTQTLGLLLSVAQTNGERVADNLIGSSEITLELGKAAKKTLEYKNKTNHKKSIRVSTNHTEYIHIDPSHYEVPANKKARLRLIFMPRDKEEYVVLHVFVQEADMPKSSLEYYKVTAHYVAQKDDDDD